LDQEVNTIFWQSSGVQAMSDLVFVFNTQQWYGDKLVECWTSDQEIKGLTVGRAPLCSNPRLVVHPSIPLSPSSIIWYWPMAKCSTYRMVSISLAESNDRLLVELWLNITCSLAV